MPAAACLIAACCVLAGVTGCKSPPLAPTPDAAVQPAPEAPPTESESEEALPLPDVHLIQAFPERYLGHVVVCDTLDVGPLREAPAHDLRLRALGLSHTRSLHCSSGFVQLAFRPSSSALAAFIRPHRRLRARVRDAGHERWLTPIVEFVAQSDDDLPTPEPSDVLFAPMEVGDDLRPAAIGAAGQRSRSCVVAWVGSPRRVEPASADDPQFALSVSCHHATGDAWIELHVPPTQVAAVLATTRGQRISTRITSLSGGRGRYPRAVLAGE